MGKRDKNLEELNEKLKVRGNEATKLKERAKELLVRVSSETHRQLKIRAAEEGTSMQKLMEDAIEAILVK